MSNVRKYHGVELIKVEEGRYKTPDGRFEIYRDDEFETECMDAHPCRLGKKLRAEIGARYNWEINQGRDHYRAIQQTSSVYGADAVAAWQDGKKGWYCYGGETHFYSQWVAWEGEYGWSAEWTDTFKDACEDLKAHLGKLASEPQESAWS